MAVAQAQHALREMVDTLKNDIKVSYAFILLLEDARSYERFISRSKCSYDEVFELEEINNDFANADVAFVIEHDVTNPSKQSQSPIYGMPVLDVEKCKSVLFVKEVYHLAMQELITIYFIKKIL